MKQKLLVSILISFLSANFLFAQFIVLDQTFSPNSVSNAGKISGYEFQTGPYSIWLPDSGNVIFPIGGVAPGSGVGGQAHFSDDGNFICGTSRGTSVPEMSKYDRTTGQWTTLGSLGIMVDSSLSGGFSISGDGNTVVGLAWADSASGFGSAHAVAHNATEGIMDLGSLFNGRSTRANAANYDGSVVVGWQDFNGPWKAAVWRKNPAGGYFPNEYILIDTAGNPSDEFNQIDECSTVSADGNWIGGYGDFANNNQPWIWSRDSGVINLGSFPNLGNGFVSDMSADGSVVVGWFDGQFFGDPRTPFLWTRTGGLQEFNSYINTVLGDSTGDYNVYTADCISPDGNYVSGYGVNNSTITYFVYRVSLNLNSSVVTLNTSEKINVYPNPSSGIITIENSGKGFVTIASMDGKIIYNNVMDGKSIVDISTYASGIYSLTVKNGDAIVTKRIVKN